MIDTQQPGAGAGARARACCQHRCAKQLQFKLKDCLLLMLSCYNSKFSLYNQDFVLLPSQMLH